MYKGDKKSEDLDVIGDRAGIRRDIPNRKEAVKDHMRKVSVQNNTLWMLTAGIATPLMTALACNKAEKYITPWAEKCSNKAVNTQIDNIDDYLNGRMDIDKKLSYESNVLKLSEAPKEFETILEDAKGKIVGKEDIARLSDSLTAGFDAEMKDAARTDIERLIGGEKYIANATAADNIANSIHSAILSKDAQLASKITPDKINEAISSGLVRGAVRDMLTSVGVDVIDPSGSFFDVSTNFKCKEVENIDFFKITEETKNMTPVERLAHNIKSAVLKVNNSNPAEDFIPGMSNLEKANGSLKADIDARLTSEADAIAKKFYEGRLEISSGRENYVTRAVSKLYKSEAPRGPKYDKLFSSIGAILRDDVATHKGYTVTDTVAQTLKSVGTQMKKFGTIDNILASTAHFKTEKAAETLVANNWAEVTDTLIKGLGITDKQIERAGKDKAYSRELFAKQLESVCSNGDNYNEFITKLASKMAELDEKMDTPNSKSSGRMMNKIEAGITRNCTETGDVLGRLGMSEMKTRLVSTRDAGLGINIGSLMNSKIERLHSRVDGVHSSYMRLLQTAEFFRRAKTYESEVAANGGHVTEAIAKKYGFTREHAVNKEIIAKGKELLLGAHINKFYTKMGLHNNKDFFINLMKAVYRPKNGTEGAWNENWGHEFEETVKTLDGITSKKNPTQHPRRVFEGIERRPIGQKLKEHMNQVYNSLGSITREVMEAHKETVKVDGGVSKAEQRACKRFDLLGKAPSELLGDALKQRYNSNRF